MAGGGLMAAIAMDDEEIERIAATKTEEKRMRGAPEQQEERKPIRMQKVELEEAASPPKPHEWLPFHLILGRLPVRQLFQLPSVCKHWYSMLGAGEVLLDMKTAGEEYWFVMSKPPACGPSVWDFMAFSNQSSSLQKKTDWAFFRLPLPLPSQSHSKLSSLLGGVHCTLLADGMRRTHSLGYPTGIPFLVSAGGLFCAFVHKSGAPYDYNVIVFNIMTGSVKVLPPRLDRQHLFGILPSSFYFCNIYMGFDNRDTARYYIMITHTDAFQVPDYFEVYDSRSGRWKVGQNAESATASFKVADRDFFYLDRMRSTLFAYQVAGDVWSKVRVRNIVNHEFGTAPTFLKYKGRLLLGLQLVLITSLKEKVCLGFVVFELQHATSKTATWVEVARTPLHLRQWRSHNHCLIMSEGGLFYTKTENHNKWGQVRPPLVYDVAQNLWYALPSHRGSTDLDCIFVHRPRLSMHMPYLIDGDESDEPSHGR